MKQEEVFDLLAEAVSYAKKKHPEFPGQPEAGFGIICEEMLELIRAINDREPEERQIEEALHVGATVVRFLEARIVEGV